MRLGVIGYGRRINNLITWDFRQVEPDLRVVGVVDPDETGVREKLADCDKKDVVFYKNVKEMVSKAKLDCIAIGTRCHLHAPYAVEVAKYGIPLFLEKPVANSTKQALALEAAFEKSNCPVVVSFPLRVSPLCVLARDYIEQGAVGRPDHILGVNYVTYGTSYWEKFYRTFNISSGLFFQKATHDFDYIAYVMGSPIVRIGAMACYGRVFGGDKPVDLKCSACKEAATCLESPENRKRNMSGGDINDHWCTFSKACGTPQTGMNEDSSSALMEFGSGAHGVYTQVFFSRRNVSTRGATVSGYQGTLSFDWYKNEMRRVRHHAPFSDTIIADGNMAHFGGDYELARNFFSMVRGREKSRTPIETGLASVYSCAAALESAKKGRFVKVRQVGQ